MDKINNLLQQVSTIQKKYDKIAKISGENFNIFSIMRAESDEVRTHSRIIAEFLNPKGIHNQGSIYLKLFFEEIKELKTLKDDFDYDNAKIIVEEYLGTINNEYSEGGFIDIVIKDVKNQVVIENKIYANDQKGQLYRYKKNYPNCKLIYLTLEGKTPCQSSYKIENGKELNLEKDIILVSYRDQIKKWIENCHAKSHSLPIIRETLIQYLNLIKKLTNQTTNNLKTMEILEILKKNVQQSFEITRSIEPLKSKLYYDFFENLIQFSKNKEIMVDTRNLNNKSNFGLYLIPKEWHSKPYKIVILFDPDFGIDYSGLYVGLNFNENISEIDKDLIQEKFDKIIPKFSINSWNIWREPSNRDWANNSEIWEDIAKEEKSETYKEIISIIEEIIDIEKN